jgi:threonine dehydrogenase-like Zn-dependent dehydrogenase
MEHKFYSAWMTGPDPDRLRYAQIAGAARHARAWLTTDEEAAAVAELKQTAAGRADLLAECAGTALGFGEGGQDAARYRQIAELCIAAGADQTLIECWIAIGRQRAAIARAMAARGPPRGRIADPSLSQRVRAQCSCRFRTAASNAVRSAGSAQIRRFWGPG